MGVKMSILKVFVIVLLFFLNNNVVLTNIIFDISNFTVPIPIGPLDHVLPFKPTDQGKSDGGSYNSCSCKPVAACPNDGFWNIIDIRIVTPPGSTECEPGYVHCCLSGTDCGTNRVIQVPDMPSKPGQAEFGEYPWQALILTLNNDYVGSGALISSNHVITAAHRMTYFTKKGQRLFVRLGDWDLLGIKEPYPFIDILINQVMIHPQYDAISLQNNVAILSLMTPVTMTTNINTICLPPPNAFFIGKTCWVSGWGKDMFGPSGNYQTVLKKVDVTILNPNDCDQRFRNTRLGPHFTLDQQSFICAGGYKGKDACTGDGGSPLVCQNPDGHWVLAGLVAWGLGCAQNGIPGVYVNIPSMMNWIQQQIQPPAFNTR